MKWRMCSWQRVVPLSWPWARPLTMAPHDAADAFAAVVVEGDRLLAREGQLFVDHVEHLQKGHVRGNVRGRIVFETPFVRGAFLAPDFQRQADGLAHL